MTLKEQLAEKKAELVALKDGIEAGDADAIKAGEEVTAAIEELNNTIASAQKAQDMLSQIGEEPAEDTAEEEAPKMSETTLKNLDMTSLKSGRGSVGVNIKAAADAVASTAVTVTDTNVVDVQKKLSVRDLFGSESISGNAMTYFIMGATDGTPAVTAEGTKKPQIHPNYDKKTVALEKIAAYLKETDELLNDNAFLDSAVRGRGIYEHNLAVENKLVADLLKTSGIQSVAEAISFDSILKAKANIATATGYQADAIVLNPADLQTLMLEKDTNKQYLLGGPAFGAYGNGSYTEGPKIWGLTVVESSAVAAGTAVVGAFKTCGSVVTKAGEGLRVEVSNSNEDDFINNMVTVRIEERLTEAIRIPAGFAKIAAA